MIVRVARTLERSDRQSLLAEALATRATALARLGRHSAALAAFQRAITLCKHIGSMSRAAHVALTLVQEVGDSLTVADRTRPISGRTLREEIYALEHDLIKQALEVNDGSITFAARSLGMTYQNLDYALNMRHKDLLKKRTPVRRRPRKQ